MTIKFTTHGRVADWVAALHQAFAIWLRQKYVLKHTIRIHLCQKSELLTRHGPAWGYFNPGKRPAIVVTCLRPGKTEDERFFRLLDTMAHEWVHYEQFRDNKPLSHRGLQRRVDGLVREFMRALKQCRDF
jgi:hypothetical protein